MEDKAFCIALLEAFPDSAIQQGNLRVGERRERAAGRVMIDDYTV